MWPGGYAIAKFLEENPVVRNTTVLDVGSGSGVASLAAHHAKAARVVANDICTVAAAALEVKASQFVTAD